MFCSLFFSRLFFSCFVVCLLFCCCLALRTAFFVLRNGRCLLARDGRYLRSSSSAGHRRSLTNRQKQPPLCFPQTALSSSPQIYFLSFIRTHEICLHCTVQGIYTVFSLFFQYARTNFLFLFLFYTKVECLQEEKVELHVCLISFFLSFPVLFLYTSGCHDDLFFFCVYFQNWQLPNRLLLFLG